MKKLFKKFNLKFILFILSFIVGAVIFFPLMDFQDTILNKVNSNPSFQLQTSRLKLGTGLNMGASSGLIALHAENSQLTFNRTITLDCMNLSISPSFVKLITGSIAISVLCKQEPVGDIQINLSSQGFFKTEIFDIDTELTRVDISFLSSIKSLKGLKGNISGEANVKSYKTRSGKFEILKLDVFGKNMKTPQFKTPQMTFPSISSESLKAKVNMTTGNLKIEKIELKGETNPIQGYLTINAKTNSRNALQSGILEGNLKVDPDFEEQHFSFIGLDTFLGESKSDGFRSFKKRISPTGISNL